MKDLRDDPRAQQGKTVEQQDCDAADLGLRGSRRGWCPTRDCGFYIGVRHGHPLQLCFLECAEEFLGHCGASMDYPELRRVAVTDWNEVMADSIRWLE
ncbi:hypothetical protein BTHE68_19400 [Burkholderia sp. THE68]|nr:hypothetical protein BTHE68_19400 [Burkholderia sp. THE68]